MTGTGTPKSKRGTAPEDEWDVIPITDTAGVATSALAFSIKNLDASHTLLVLFGDDDEDDAIPLTPGESIGIEGHVDSFSVYGDGGTADYVAVFTVPR